MKKWGNTYLEYKVIRGYQRERGWREDRKGKGGQIYGERRKLGFLSIPWSI